MAKFSSKNIEFKNWQKAIFGSGDESDIHWNPDNAELTITTVVSGVDPIDPGHLVTRRYLEDELATVSGGIIQVHGNLSGLGADDHTQYHNDTRADTWLGTKSIDDIGDVTTPTPVDGQVLTWSGAANQWVSRPVPPASDGVTLTAEWKFDDSTTDSDPGNGKFRLDATLQTNATYVYVDDYTNQGYDASFVLSKLKTGDAIYIQDKSTSAAAMLAEMSGDAVDGTGYWKLPITNVKVAGTEFDKNKVCGFIFHYSNAVTTLDHGVLTGLNDDDHTQYLLVSGTRQLTGNWDAGDYSITAKEYYGNGATLSGVAYIEDDDVYFYDTTRSKDLGVAVIQIDCGRSSNNTTNQYLRTADGVQMNRTGIALPYDATLVGISMMGQRNNQTWTAQVRKNGVVTNLDSLTITNVYENHTWSKDTDFSAGDRIQVYMSGTNINHPRVTLFFRRTK